jgi:peptide chain release factor 1
MKGTAKLKDFLWSVFDASSSSIVYLLEGKDVSKKFSLEAGIHRVQRVPPTEHKGRRHTSTIAVAVLPYEDRYEYQVDMSEFEIDCYCGGGPGGQHRNTTNSNVRIVHKPTKLSACANTKSQHRNRQIALSILLKRIENAEKSVGRKEYNAKRKEQIRDKGRGTKVRTYNFIENRVKDERVKKKFRTQDIMRGKLFLIYKGHERGE